MICASVCLLLPISSSPESENHTQFCADPGGQVSWSPLCSFAQLPRKQQTKRSVQRSTISSCRKIRIFTRRSRRSRGGRSGNQSYLRDFQASWESLAPWDFSTEHLLPPPF